MPDIVTAAHPVPVLAARGRGRPAWGLAAMRTEVEIPRVDVSEVRRAGEMPYSGDGSSPVQVVEIGGRFFVEVSDGSDGRPGIAEVLSGPGTEHARSLSAAGVNAATPASARLPGADGALRRSRKAHDDHRGEGIPGKLAKVVEDHVDLARSALRGYVAENVRVAGASSYVDAGGPLFAPVEKAKTYQPMMVPRAWGTYSCVRLRQNEIKEYSESTGFMDGRRSHDRLPGWISAGGDGDLIFLNAAASGALVAIAPLLAKARAGSAAVTQGAAAAFEAMLRPAWLGSCGLLGEADLAPVLRVLSDGARHYKDTIETFARSGNAALKAIAAEHDDDGRLIIVRRMHRDIAGWALPRALEREARFDSEDLPFLPGPAA